MQKKVKLFMYLFSQPEVSDELKIAIQSLVNKLPERKEDDSKETRKQNKVRNIRYLTHRGEQEENKAAREGRKGKKKTISAVDFAKYIDEDIDNVKKLFTENPPLNSMYDSALAEFLGVEAWSLQKKSLWRSAEIHNQKGERKKISVPLNISEYESLTGKFSRLDEQTQNALISFLGTYIQTMVLGCDTEE